MVAFSFTSNFKAMENFESTVLKFGAMGEKTGWTYIRVPAAVAVRLNIDKRSFRVRGKIGNVSISMAALIPMGGGDFILPLNAKIRKGLGPAAELGSVVPVEIEFDPTPQLIDADLLTCLSDQPEAMQQFESMPPSHQLYYSKWIGEAKTAATKDKRIAMTVEAMLRHMDFGQMLRWERERRGQG